jgi:hypothetical protein
MIFYTRTYWYGFHYFFRIAGSALPRCLPMMTIAAVVSGVIASFKEQWPEGWTEVVEHLEDKYALQLLGIVFGYMSINRVGILYGRRARRLAPAPDHLPS